MRNLFFTTAFTIALAFAWGLALAQDNTSGTTGALPTAVDANKLIGRNIVNTNGDTVGEIDSVVIDQSGKVRYVVVGVGGFLGIGKKDVALAWDELKISDNGEKVTTAATKDQLAALPEHKFPETVKPGTVYPYDEAVRTNPSLASPEEMAPAAGMTGIKASKLVGATVRNAAGDNIGEIHELLLSNDGKTKGFVIDVGGFLGLGEHTVLLPWSDVIVQADANGAITATTKMDRNQLEKLPEYKL